MGLARLIIQVFAVEVAGVLRVVGRLARVVIIRVIRVTRPSLRARFAPIGVIIGALLQEKDDHGGSIHVPTTILTANFGLLVFQGNFIVFVSTQRLRFSARGGPCQ